MSSEEMARAARSINDAAEEMRKAVGQFDDAVYRLGQLFGSGYGNNVERLIEQLEIYNNAQKPDVINMSAPVPPLIVGDIS